MPIMETIRNSTDSTAARLVFGAIVLVFVFWGVGGSGPMGETYAVVNGDRITDTSFRKAYQNFTSGQTLDDDEAREVQAQVLDMLIEQMVMLQTATDLGVAVSDSEIAAQLLAIDAFKGPDGKFNPELYERTLKRMGMTKGTFEQSLHDDLMRNKLDRILQAGVQVTESELKRRYEESATQLSIAWVRIPDEAVLASVPVTEGDVQVYLTTRTEAIKAAYDREFNTRWSEPAKARISRIVLKTRLPTGVAQEEAVVRERLKAVLAEARGGADFATLARRWSEDPSTVLTGGVVGQQTAVQMGPVVSEAVFAAAPDTVTEILDTARGLEIVYVHAKTEAKVTTLESASDAVARELVAKDGVDLFADNLAGRISAAWTTESGPPEALLTEYGLSVVRPPPTSKAEPKLIGASDATAFVAAVKAATDVGIIPGVHQAENARIVGAIEVYQRADPATWEMQKDLFMGMYARSRAGQYTQRWRSEAVAAAEITAKKTFR
jgi:peptidyl-prolyl cis-trans isomerase D